MTITRRLTILVAVPILALIGLGIFIKVQLAGIETRSRLLVERQIPSVAALGNISRTYAELRVSSRGYLLRNDRRKKPRPRRHFISTERTSPNYFANTRTPLSRTTRTGGCSTNIGT